MASTWKQLPDELSGPARRLTEDLRAIKDAAGLSLSELATRTHYSRASWERWLNGKRVVTEQALEALIGAVECDGARLRALWAEASAPEAAEDAPAVEGLASDAPAADAAGEAPVEEAAVEAAVEETPETPEASESGESGESGDDSAPGPIAGPVWWRRPLVLVTCAAVALALLVLAGVRLSGADGDQAVAAQSVPPTTAAPSPAGKTAGPAQAVPACQGLGCSHKDPKTTGCGADARTLQTSNVGKVVVYLRYSQKCQAAWAAITEGAPGDASTITSSSGELETALIHWGYDNYSAMVNAADPATTFQVCGQRAEANGGGGACTMTVSDLATLVASTPIPIGPASPPPAAAAPSPSPSAS
ncbi:DUF2690 domain-containing protein [Kitasatospora sp. NPDC052868]|uniref:helix-turn-helix domain-containing protein n=1 Tax=Kitasatospora sp. NPDC052868 TaxID=3364060 RepID=UPI0037CA45D1